MNTLMRLVEKKRQKYMPQKYQKDFVELIQDALSKRKYSRVKKGHEMFDENEWSGVKKRFEILGAAPEEIEELELAYLKGEVDKTINPLHKIEKIRSHLSSIDRQIFDNFLEDFYKLFNEYIEALDLLEDGFHQNVIDRLLDLEQNVQLITPYPQIMRIRILIELGKVYRYSGELDKARNQFAKAEGIIDSLYNDVPIFSIPVDRIEPIIRSLRENTFNRNNNKAYIEVHDDVVAFRYLEEFREFKTSESTIYVYIILQLYLGDFHRRQAEWDSADKCYKQVLEIMKTHSINENEGDEEYIKLQADVLRKIAGVLLYQGLAEEAITYSKLSLKHCENYKDGLRKANQHLAWAYSMKGRSELALGLHNDAIKTVDELIESGDILYYEKAKSLRYKANTLYSLDKTDDAKTCLDDAKKILEVSILSSESREYLILGAVKLGIAQIDFRNAYFSKSQNRESEVEKIIDQTDECLMIISNNDPFHYGRTLRLRGQIELLHHNSMLAFEYFDNAYKLFKEINNRYYYDEITLYKLECELYEYNKHPVKIYQIWNTIRNIIVPQDDRFTHHRYYASILQIHAEACLKSENIVQKYIRCLIQSQTTLQSKNSNYEPTRRLLWNTGYYLFYLAGNEIEYINDLYYELYSGLLRELPEMVDKVEEWGTHFTKLLRENHN